MDHFTRNLSLIFLILTNILVCFSTSDNLHRVRKEGRELLPLGTLAGVVKQLPNVKEVAYKLEESIAEHYLKNFLESVAGKLFGSGGQRGFRVGWKAGKLYYSVADKCENRTAGLQCETASSPCNNTCGDSDSVICVIYCVVEVFNLTGLIDSCFERCGAPIETPCSYKFNDTNLSNGTITCPNN